MVKKLFLTSIILFIVPMMGIPFLQLKIPPLYQIILLFLSISILLYILKIGRIRKDLLYVLLLIFILYVYLLFINSSILQIISLISYLIILAIIRYSLYDLILKEEKYIDKILINIYYVMIFISILQIIAYKVFNVMFLIDYNHYLTSGIYSYTLNSPVSGWNQSFRPNAFFAEPSFLGFFIVIFTLYKYQKDYKISFILFNILLLHIFGIRSGEVVLLLVLIYILSDKFFGKKLTFSTFITLMIIFLFCLLIFNNYLINEIKSMNLDYSSYERLILLLQGIEVFKNNIFIGVGLGNLSSILSLNDMYEREVSNIGNLYIQIFSEVGILGFLILSLILSRIFYFSYSLLALILSLFFVGGYSLLYMWIIPLLVTIYMKGKK